MGMHIETNTIDGPGSKHSKHDNFGVKASEDGVNPVNCMQIVVFNILWMEEILHQSVDDEICY